MLPLLPTASIAAWAPTREVVADDVAADLAAHGAGEIAG